MTARGLEAAKNGQRVHSGRTLVLKGRQSKTWSLQPLPVKISTGKRGMGPETAEEVPPAMQKQVPKSALLAVDGARAWKRAADGRLILTGVNHQKKMFTHGNFSHEIKTDTWHKTSHKNGQGFAEPLGINHHILR